jgi:hypothetical protein
MNLLQNPTPKLFELNSKSFLNSIAATFKSNIISRLTEELF